MKKNLTVFTKAPCEKWNIAYKIKWFFVSLKCAYQRAIRGYCYRDLWNLDHFYTQLFSDSLMDFKENLHGAPAEFFDSNSDNEIIRWENYIEEMATHFYNSIEENEVQKNEFEEEFHRLHPTIFMKEDEETEEQKEVYNKWLARQIEINNWRRAELNKGLDMLKENFESLWD